jgi:calcineurin-like phosphoesterase family protein
MTVFVISDLHLGQQSILNFEREDGSKLRPFRGLHEMHGYICDRWRSVVTNDDKVYVLGDVAKIKSVKLLLHGLPGMKRLVRGNHDKFSDNWYHEAGFQHIYGVRQLGGVWLTHVPMHPQSMEGRVRGNIHGHMHANVVKCDGPTPHEQVPDNRYFNACVEQIDYTPVKINTIIEARGWGDPL